MKETHTVIPLEILILNELLRMGAIDSTIYNLAMKEFSVVKVEKPAA